MVTVDQPEITITAANDYETARLQVTKLVTGPGRGQATGKVFDLLLSCVLPAGAAIRRAHR